MKALDYLTDWKTKHIWRHHILWSYRIDLLLIILGIYALMALIIGIAFIYTSSTLSAKIEISLQDFSRNRSILLEVLGGTTARAPTAEDVTRIKTVVFIDPSNLDLIRFRKEFSEELGSPFQSRFKAELIAGLADPKTNIELSTFDQVLQQKIGDWYVLALYVTTRIRSSFALLGGLFQSS
jgi:hypothetical protein